MSGPTYYDREGRRISTMEWVRLFNDVEYKRVAFLRLPFAESYVSAVWFGMDHAFFVRPMSTTWIPDRKPLIYNTIVVVDGRIRSDRYFASAEEAKAEFDALAERWGFYDDRPLP